MLLSISPNFPILWYRIVFKKVKNTKNKIKLALVEKTLIHENLIFHSFLELGLKIF